MAMNRVQFQPGLSTIQGAVNDAARKITEEHIVVQGASRTDAGVHALAQVASFAVEAPIPPASFHRALNRTLPPSIRILSAELRSDWGWNIIVPGHGTLPEDFPTLRRLQIRLDRERMVARLPWGTELPLKPFSV